MCCEYLKIFRVWLILKAPLSFTVAAETAQIKRSVPPVKLLTATCYNARNYNFYHNILMKSNRKHFVVWFFFLLILCHVYYCWSSSLHLSLKDAVTAGVPEGQECLASSNSVLLQITPSFSKQLTWQGCKFRPWGERKELNCQAWACAALHY